MGSSTSARILFRPICSNCGKELKEYINFIEDPKHVFGEHDFVFVNYRLEPTSCPFCHAWFNCIEIPTELPFDNR